LALDTLFWRVSGTIVGTVPADDHSDRVVRAACSIRGGVDSRAKASQRFSEVFNPLDLLSGIRRKAFMFGADYVARTPEDN
jgi:hypothetical protein